MNRRVLAVGMTLVLPLLGILMAGLGRDPHVVRSPLVGRAAPAFSLPRVDGGPPLSLEELRGRPVVLNFWATWCVPCYEEHGLLTRAARDLDGRVRFVGIVYQDDQATVRQYLARHGSSYPSLLDPSGRTGIAYGVFGVPETFVLDATGTVVAKQMGPLDDSQLRAHLAKVGVQP